MKKSNFKKYTVAYLLAALLALAPLISAQASQHPYLKSHGIVFSTGNKHLSEVDYSLASPVQAISFKRYYNSLSTLVGPFGHGWSMGIAHFSTLKFYADKIVLVESNGRRVQFLPQGGDTWVNTTGKNRTIVLTGGIYELTDSKGNIRVFDSSGKITEDRDRNNSSILFSYTGELLSGVSNSFGQQLTFTYANNLISVVSTPTGDFSYFYDANNNLTSVQKPDTTTQQYIYDDPSDLHNLTGIIDENSTRIATIEYDTQDRVISSSKANGQDAYQIEYPSDLQRVITDGLGVATTYQLVLNNGVMRVASFIGPGCSSFGDDTGSSYVYNDRMQITQKTDARGTVTAYEYDTQGNLTKLIKALGSYPEQHTTSYTYTADNRLDTITSYSTIFPIGEIVTSHSYDANGNLLSRTESGYDDSWSPISKTTSYSYDTYGRITSIDGSRTDVSDITTFSYYPNDEAQGLNRGNLQSVTNALGHTTSYSNYTALGKTQTITDPLGTTSYTYDTLGRLLSRSRNGIVTSYLYDFTGKLTTINLPDSRTITYGYTDDGKVSSVEDSLGNKISYFYDARGQKNREEIHDPQSVLQHFVDYAYHPSGKLSTTTYADGSSEQLDYDEVGNLVSKVNALNKTTSYAYDALNRLTTITEPGTIVTVFQSSMSPLDYPYMITDAEGHATIFIYDDLGRRLVKTSPDTGLTTYIYDEADNLLSSTDESGITTSYEYDALNRLLAVHYPDPSQDVVYNYDENGHTGLLTTMQDSTGTTSYDYDILGRLIQESRTQNGLVFTTGYGYNNNSELTSITYPGGRVITYNRDASGNVSSVTTTIDSVTSTIADSIAYLPFGPTTNMTLGNGIVTSNSYDQLYRRTNSTAGTIYNRNYTYLATGHVDSITDNLDPTASQGFTYDDLGRLTAALGNYGSMSWSYDNVGNRLSQDIDGIFTNYNYEPGTNQLILADAKKDTDYTYDAVGNTTSINGTTFNWDQNNRLTSADLLNKTIGIYGYDGRGLRTIRTAVGNTIHSVYDGSGNVLLEADDLGNILNEYVYLNGTRLAVFDQASQVYHYISDHLSTAQLLVDDQGVVVWQGNYTPFGEVDVVVDMIENNFRFPGQYFDSETGLHYNWNRYYDPGTGRYITADPIGLAGGINLYAYVQGNPVNLIDPMGLEYSSGVSPEDIDYGGPGSWASPPQTPDYWNGNFYPGSEPQDGVCSSIADPLNDNVCTRSCCEEHDRCYARNRCNQSSWIGTFTPYWAPACQRCNREAAKCVARNICRDDGNCI